MVREYVYLVSEVYRGFLEFLVVKHPYGTAIASGLCLYLFIAIEWPTIKELWQKHGLRAPVEEFKECWRRR